MSFNSEYLPVELNNVSYRIDTTQYRRTTVPVARQQRDNSKEPGENTLDTTGAWVRSQTDWSLGAGQLYLDNEDSDRRRFFSSLGIDIWTKGQVTLLNKMIATVPSGISGTNIIVKRFGTYIYVATNTQVYFSNTLTAASITWTPMGATSGAVVDMTSDGTYVYFAVATPNAIQRQTIGSAIAPATLGSQVCSTIQMAAGRLIGTNGAAIFELDAAGAKATGSLDYTFPFTNSLWKSITAGATGIYAAANTDNTGSVYYIGTNATNGALTAPILAGSLPRNETINTILGYGGFLLLATSKGLRVALIDTSSSSITIGPAIDTGGEAFSLEVDGQFVWWGTGLGLTYRANLSTFTASLEPAYASDLQASIASPAATDIVQSIARIDGKLFTGIKSAAAVSLYRESHNNERVETGSLVAGEITWSTVVPKLLRSGVIDLDRSQYENSSVHYSAAATDYTNTTDTYTFGAATSTAVGTISLTAKNGNNVAATLSNLSTGKAKVFNFTDNVNVAITFDITLTLTRGVSPTNKAPICHDWQCTAVAVPDRIDEIIVPVILKREVITSRASGSPQRFASGDSFTVLRNLMESGAQLIYKEGTRTDTVTIERLEMSAERLSDDGSWWEGTLMVRLLTVPPVPE